MLCTVIYSVQTSCTCCAASCVVRSHLVDIVMAPSTPSIRFLTHLHTIYHFSNHAL